MTDLQQNRVYNIGEIDTLRTECTNLLDVGIFTCTSWDKTIEKVRDLFAKCPNKAPELGNALNAITGSFLKPEYEDTKNLVSTALSGVTFQIPQVDYAGAEAVRCMTDNTVMIPDMINDLAECLKPVTLGLSLSEFQEKLDGVKEQWDGESADANLEAYQTILLGGFGYSAFGADPVNMSTGNFLYQYTDLEIKGRLPLSFNRTYNGISKHKGTMGRGWFHNWEKNIVTQVEKLTLFHADGREEYFTEQENGVYISKTSGIRIFQTEEGYNLKDPKGIKEQYNSNGQLICLEEKGKKTLLTYEENRLTTITQDGDEWFKLLYNETEELTGVCDHTGRQIRFTYAGKKLTSVTDPEGNTFTYEYGSNGRICKILDKRGVSIVKNDYDEYRRIKKQSFPDGGVIDFTYQDKQNRLKLTLQNGSTVAYIHDKQFRSKKICYEDGFEETGYDENGHISRKRDKNGNETLYVRDEAGNLLKLTNALGQKTVYERNSKGKVTAIHHPNECEEKLFYDAKGRPQKVITANGGETTLVYEDENTRPSQVILADGSTMKIKYDKRGNILSVDYPDGTSAFYTYDRLNRVTESRDGNGNETRFTYDGQDRIIQVKRPDGAKQNYIYNPMGEALKIEDFDGHAMTWEYNVLNKPSVYTDKQGRQTRMDYDRMWNVSKITDPEGGITEYAYDAMNRLKEVTDSLNRKITFSYDSNGNRTKIGYPDGTQVTYEYDALDRKIKETDRMSRVTLTEYDVMGNVSCITDNEGNKTCYEYDKAGKKVKETDRTGAVTLYTYTVLGDKETITHPSGKVERFHYGPGGQLVKHDKGDSTWETYRHDKAGNLIRSCNQENVELTYEYDCLNRMTRILQNGSPQKTYTYDAMGNMTSMEDAAGRITQYAYSPSGKLSMVTDPLGNRVLYSYNGRDELTGILQLKEGEECVFLPAEKAEGEAFLDEDWKKAKEHNEKNHDLHLTLFERDKAGRITTVTNALGGTDHYTYDVMDKATQRIDPEGQITSWEYHPDGQIKTIHWPDGKTVECSYDALARLNRLKDWLGETTFAYDAEGRLTKSTDHNGDTVTYGWNPDGTKDFMCYPNGRRVSYDYDQTQRLLGITSGEFKVDYEYDPRGHLFVCRRDNGIHTFYGYDSFGRLHELTHKKQDKILDSFLCEYDSRGNKIAVSRQSSDAAYNFNRIYEYDILDRLIAVKEDGQAVVSYKYDSYGNRIEEKRFKTGSEYSKEPLEKHLSYNAMNQLISDDESNYFHDKQGNLTSIKKDGIEERTLSYDGMGMLAEICQNGDSIQKLLCNGMGNRIGNESISYGIDYADPYRRILTEREHGSANSVYRNYLWQNDTFIGIPEEGTHVLTDFFHSPVRVTDKEGSTRNIYQYDEFGGVTLKEETVAILLFCKLIYATFFTLIDGDITLC